MRTLQTLITMQDVRVIPRPIKYYMQECSQEEIKLPVWQRLDGWDSIKDTGPKEYKMCFIKALISKFDIPKIYLYKLSSTDQISYILDGGHRTRAIQEFMEGEFGIKLNDNNYYWYSITGNEPKPRKAATWKNLLLPNELKVHFENLTLDIVTYSNISEEMARTIFNELNHHRPMEPAEVINSWSSALVDRMRDLYGTEYQGSTYIEALKSTMKVGNTDMHEYMKTFTALFSLIERTDKDTFDYCEPKNALRYIRSNNELNTQFSEELIEPLWNNFIEACDRYFKLINALRNDKDINSKWCPCLCEGYSYFHFINNDVSKHDISDIIVVLGKFIKTYVEYKSESNSFKKILKKGDEKTKEEVDKAHEEFTKLQSRTDLNVISWCTNMSGGPGGPKNMSNRYNILKQLFKLS